MTDDLLICGAGPSGRALAHRALATGLSVTVVDPQPQRRWSATYAAWADELPTWLPAGTLATVVDRPLAWTTRPIEVERRYAVLDTPGLQDALTLDGARMIRDRVTAITRPSRTGTGGVELPAAWLASGRILPAGRVIDARGVPRSPAHAEQTAFGVIVERERWTTQTLFMDWRDDNGADAAAPRSFLYAVPLDDDRVLLEETCLAGRPALSIRELHDRLVHRLRCRGIELTGEENIERVRFPVQGGTPGAAFGAAGALMHPATGYSVAASLRLADTVVAGDSIWPSSARAVHRLRQAGLRALLALPPAQLPVFFDAFFTLPIAAQRAYLSGRDDLRGTASAMTALFAALPWRLRGTLARAVTMPSPRPDAATNTGYGTDPA